MKKLVVTTSAALLSVFAMISMAENKPKEEDCTVRAMKERINEENYEVKKEQSVECSDKHAKSHDKKKAQGLDLEEE